MRETLFPLLAYTPGINFVLLLAKTGAKEPLFFKSVNKITGRVRLDTMISKVSVLAASTKALPL